MKQSRNNDKEYASILKPTPISSKQPVAPQLNQPNTNALACGFGRHVDSMHGPLPLKLSIRHSTCAFKRHSSHSVSSSCDLSEQGHPNARDISTPCKHPSRTGLYVSHHMRFRASGTSLPPSSSHLTFKAQALRKRPLRLTPRHPSSTALTPYKHRSLSCDKPALYITSIQT